MHGLKILESSTSGCTLPVIHTLSLRDRVPITLNRSYNSPWSSIFAQMVGIPSYHSSMKWALRFYLPHSKNPKILTDSTQVLLNYWCASNSWKKPLLKFYTIWNTKQQDHITNFFTNRASTLWSSLGIALIAKTPFAVKVPLVWSLCCTEEVCGIQRLRKLKSIVLLRYVSSETDIIQADVPEKLWLIIWQRKSWLNFLGCENRPVKRRSRTKM